MNMVKFANDLGNTIIGERREHQREIDKFEKAYKEGMSNEDRNSENHIGELQGHKES